ncbi:hypothetical protein F7731_11565 [Cytobacillus depressus]|uniref:Big-1 domain-containing protein n=1 Tax=Cytobacillus depressus TaxID=1602942 RepID=A0A6L3V4T2_9BACI|nr:hypothetical protein [Cytobacillus depressus]KAB2336134.1 hypothetical protein F7731_11565 [Cytobacillus depressus]
MGVKNFQISLSATQVDCQPFTLHGVFTENGVGVPGVTIMLTITAPATVSPALVTTGAGGTFSATVSGTPPGQPVTITATSVAVDGIPSVSTSHTFTCSL